MKVGDYARIIDRDHIYYTHIVKVINVVAGWISLSPLVPRTDSWGRDEGNHFAPYGIHPNSVVVVSEEEAKQFVIAWELTH